MTIEIRQPEVERLIREAIRNGHFGNVDDLLIEALEALREKTGTIQSTAEANNAPNDLARFLMESSFSGSDLDLDRRQDYGRTVDL